VPVGHFSMINAFQQGSFKFKMMYFSKGQFSMVRFSARGAI
jgi:hypothetical protein